MAGDSGKLAVAAIAGATLVAGIAAGWLGGRASLPPAPPPPTYHNPLRDAVKGETLVLHRAGDRAVTSYRVLQADAESVLLASESSVPGTPSSTKEMRVSRTYFGPLFILEGDIPKQSVEASLRDFQLATASPEILRVDSLGRSLSCWKFTGASRLHGTLTYWISDEVPVHGLVRMATEKGVQWEIGGYGVPK